MLFVLLALPVSLLSEKKERHEIVWMGRWEGPERSGRKETMVRIYCSKKIVKIKEKNLQVNLIVLLRPQVKKSHMS